MSNLLVIDVGGTNVKLGVDGREILRFPSGSNFPASEMCRLVKEKLSVAPFNEVLIGFPAPVSPDGVILAEPKHLGRRGWVGFDFAQALGMPVRIVNDTVLQAVGAYRSGRMLYLGLGTGLGACLIAGHVVIPLEISSLPFRDGLTFGDHLANRGIERFGQQRWTELLYEAISRLQFAFVATEIVLGGGHANRLTEEALPIDCRKAGANAAFIGGLRLYETPCKFTNA